MSGTPTGTGLPHGTPAGPLRAVVEELALGGVRDVVICPGSRSTPLALALRAEPRLRCWVHLDERAGAFFALGAARSSRRPVAILVTSGTAAVELGPAIVEAWYGRVPLIALTADRPPELRDRGAPQAIDQAYLFGRHAKWYAELPVPEPGAQAEAHVRGIVGRALAVATTAPAGPVQLDLPYREPLVPTGRLGPGAVEPTPRGVAGAAMAGGTGHPFAGMLPARRALADSALDDVAARLASAERGIIVCGPLDVPGFAGAVADLASGTGFPILADALSGVRFGAHDRGSIVARADLLLRVPAFAEALRPDLVLRFGGTPVSKALLGWLTAVGAPQIVVDDGGWNEPTLLPVTMVHAEPAGLARDLAARLTAGSRARDDVGRSDTSARAPWLASWRAAESAAAAAARAWIDGLGEPFEGQVLADLPARLPESAVLFVGNSMPVRDLESLGGDGPAPLRCLGNRGANGIDGLVSTALGMAAAQADPVVAVVGDISFLHDLNALVAARRLGISLTLVVIDNDGGGIFSFLPQAQVDDPGVGLPEHFEALFGTPHGIELGPLVRALGASHEIVATAALAKSAAASAGRPGVHVLEVRTDRRRNVTLHRDLQAAVVAAVERTTARPPVTPGEPGERR